jgi:hypothetical protein
MTAPKQHTLTWTEFEEQFKPINNKFSKDPDLQMFETYGKELEFVQAQDPLTIWTYLDTDGGSVTVEGMHYVNRIGYFITEIPYVEDDSYEVDLQVDTCDNCEGAFGDFQHDDGLCDDCCEGCEMDDN